jgi:4-amino-4-deoxy-L-arabinose transferase-like glycosyltransferase
MSGTAATSENRIVTPAPVTTVEWLWLGVAILLSLAVRIPFFRMPMLADEGGYAYATRGWVNGTGQLYDDLWISRPQGIFYVYAGIFDIFGTGTTALRFAAWIAIAITLVAVWTFARMCGGPVAGLIAAGVFALTSSSPNIEGFSANAEMFMGCPVALAAAWLLRVSRCGWRGWELSGIGILIGAGISLKPSAAVMIPVVIAYIALVDHRGTRLDRMCRSAWFMAGVLIVAIGSLINGWMLGWDDFIYATFTYRLTAQSAATVGLQHNLEAILRLTLRALPLVILVAALLVFHHRGGITRAIQHLRNGPVTPHWPRRKSRSRLVSQPRNNGRTLLRFWIVGAIVGASIGGDWWPHYLTQLVAPLSVWIAWTLVDLWPGLRRNGRCLAAIGTIVALLFPYQLITAGGPTEMADAMFAHPGYPAQDAVAAYLREHTEPGTTIYVAFDQASIYYLADRPPAYRHLYDQELRGIPSSYSDLITIIRSPDRPQYIVSTRQPGPFADSSRAFWQEVGQYYEVVETIDGVPIYQDKSTVESGQ